MARRDYGSVPLEAAPAEHGDKKRVWAFLAFGALGLACVALIVATAGSQETVVLASGDAADSSTNAEVDAEVKKIEAAALGKALKAQKRALVGLAAEGGAEGGDDDYKPPLYAHYKKGMLGVAATSKWVSADHPKGHKKCPLHDIDCDELWPWGKVHVHEEGPPKRHGPLGDNLVGVFGEDDRVVETKHSGLLPKVKAVHDHFDHWDPESKQNKDLLYGSARYVLSRKHLGIGDQYVPLKALETNSQTFKDKEEPLADLFLGSWELGFHKPHDHEIKRHINMFDQPYRQHQSVIHGNGHVVYKNPYTPIGKSLGED